MRAAVVTKDLTFEVASVPDPVLAPDGVLVRVEACGICGSDLHMRGAGIVYPGMIMGHEIGGVIAQVGPDAETDLRVGDVVAVMPGLPDGTCAQCRSGRPQLCPNMMTTSMGLGLNPGALAEYVAAMPRQCYPAAAGVDAYAAAIAEPLAVGMHGVVESGIAAGEHAVVLGGGSIGTMTALALRATGVTDLVVSEPSEERRDMLGRLGFDAVEPSQVLGRSHAPAVVYDCTGVGPVLQEACNLVRPGGTVMMMGVVEKPAEIMPVMWVMREVTVKGILAYGETFPDAVAAVGDGRVDSATLTSSRVPLEGTEEAFQLLATAAAPPKILVTPFG